MRIRKKAIGMLTMAGVCMLAMAGCGEGAAEEPIRTSTIVLSADGSFTQCRVEKFDKDYYQLSELESMIRQEVSDYVSIVPVRASESGQSVAVEQVSVLEEDNSQVMVALHFAGSGVYGDYMAEVDRQSSELFYGTVQEALSRGYDLAGSLQDAKKGAAITAEQLGKNGEKMILIFEDALQIRCPSKVLYISGNVRLTEAGYVDGTVGEGLKYVLIK